MARKICPILLIFVVCFTVACIPSGGEEKYVVTIIADDGCNQTSGTGCILDGGFILTAAHIFTGTRENGVCSVTTYDGSTYETEIISLDVDNDLALLRSPRKDGMSLSSNDPKRGSRAYVWGADGEIPSTVLTTQECIAPDKPPVLIKLDAYLSKGMSGAPVTDKSGAVTGIVCARSINGDCSYAIPATVLSDFIDRALFLSDGNEIPI